MHALKLYGPRTGGKIRTAPHGARAGPVSGRKIFVQNNPGTARTGPGIVMWLRHEKAIELPVIWDAMVLIVTSV